MPTSAHRKAEGQEADISCATKSDIFKSYRHAVGARPAGVFLPTHHQHPELGRHHVEALRHILADAVQRGRTAWATAVLDVHNGLVPQQVRRQGAPRFARRSAMRATRSVGAASSALASSAASARSAPSTLRWLPHQALPDGALYPSLLAVGVLCRVEAESSLNKGELEPDRGTPIAKPLPISEDRDGYDALLQALGPSPILVVMEATVHYWKNLFAVLVVAGHNVVLLNPFLSHRFQDSRLERTKTDSIDA